MATIAEDAKNILKKDIRTRFEESGFIGNVFKQQRLELEKEEKVQKQLAPIFKATQRLKTQGNILTNLEDTFTQISKNVQLLAKSMGAYVTTQEETDFSYKKPTDTLAAKKTSKQQQAVDKITETEDDEPNKLDSLLDSLLGRFKAKPKPKPKPRPKKPKPESKKPTPKKEPDKPKQSKTEKKATKAKQQAEEKAKKAGKSDKEIKKEGQKAAKQVVKKAARDEIKKAARTKLLKSLGKLGAKSIPFVGVAVGVGFALERLIEGDIVGAGLEAVGGLGSALTAIPATIAQVVRDTYIDLYQSTPESDDPSVVGERLKEIKEIAEELAKEILAPKLDVQEKNNEKATSAYETSGEFAGFQDVTPTEPPPPPPKPITSMPTMAPIETGEFAGAEDLISQPTRSIAKPTAAATTPPAGGGGEAVMEAAIDKDGSFDATAKAAIMAQTSHESGHFKALSENLNYSTSGLKRIFGKYFPGFLADSYAGKPVQIASRVYANRMGNGPEASTDGWKYRGRGFIQLTGKNNYAAAGQALGLDLVNNPDLASNVQNAAKIALWFFKRNIARITDWSDTAQVTRVVNGGTIGLSDREKEFEKYAMRYAPQEGSDIGSASTAIAATKRAVSSGSITTINVVNNTQTITTARAPRRGETAAVVGA